MSEEAKVTEDQVKRLILNKDGTMKSAFLFASTKEYLPDLKELLSEALEQARQEGIEQGRRERE